MFGNGGDLGTKDAGPDQSAGSTGGTAGASAGSGGASTGGGGSAGDATAEASTGTTGSASTGRSSTAGQSDGGNQADALVDVASMDVSVEGGATGDGGGTTGDASVIRCGDGHLDPGEQCDDGNNTNGDGCETDCTFSCRRDADCTLSDPCKGTSTCDSTSHACTKPTPLDDGTTCTNGFCSDGLCTPLTCGNGTPDSGEECDDGNKTNGDGCDTNCKFSCVSTDSARSCKPANQCTTSTCDDSTHICSTVTPVRDGTACGPHNYCLAGTCTQSRCGNSKTEVGEECDDGNSVSGDGCEPNTCVFSCHGDPDCTPSDSCKGTSTCDPTAHMCTTPTQAPDNTPCGPSGSGMACRSGLCSTTKCGDGHVDTGEECDDGNGNNGDGCETNCKWTCLASDSTRDCSSVSQINPCKTSSCDPNSHVCSAPTNLPDNKVCGDHNYCSGGNCIPATCGNGTVEPTETCDDGHQTDCGDCNANCTGPGTAAVCGDGLLCPDKEKCDDGYVDACGTCNETCTGPGDNTAHVVCGCANKAAPTDLYYPLRLCPIGQTCPPAQPVVAGCAGSVSWGAASTLCAKGCTLASVNDLPILVGVPKYNYWLSDTLYASGTSNNCSVTEQSNTSGFAACGGLVATTGGAAAAPLAAAEPVAAAAPTLTGPIIIRTVQDNLLCAASQPDGMGNSCARVGCAHTTAAPTGSSSGPFGGCASSAGATCVCPNRGQ